MKRTPSSQPDRTRLVVVTVGGLVAAALLICSLYQASQNSSYLCYLAGTGARTVADFPATPVQLQAIVHYATSRVVPQQNLAEVTVSFDVLKKIAPCNFLVYGLGFDSLMWSSLNPRGKTIFLEEDPKWVQTVLKDAPTLKAYTVNYRTQLKEADELLASYKKEPNCWPSNAFLRGNDKCKLALTGLPDEFYETEWDMIMIDAPRGYFPEAPGRMAAVFSAAVMARNRKGSGVTHVYLHDVNRRVEKTYGEEFLCRKYLKRAVGRLWHFEIPADNTTVVGHKFC